MSACKRCGSFAINPHWHGRDGTDLDLCDVCYWRTRAPVWQPPETAPRDMTVFLANFGYPWPLAAAWNPVQQEFVVADPQIGMVDGRYEDFHFQSDWEPTSELRGWMPMPAPTCPQRPWRTL